MMIAGSKFVHNTYFSNGTAGGSEIDMCISETPGEERSGGGTAKN